jgi:D-3-phosphoglycerate dehydrogenase
VSTQRRILILGDDFTPAALFAEEVRARLGSRAQEVELELLDLDGDGYQAGPIDGVREFLGSVQAFIGRVEDAEAIVTTFAPITEAVLARARRLELVICGRGGPVNVDIAAARGRGVSVAYVPGRNAEAVSEYVVGVLLGLTRRIGTAGAWLRDGSWTSGREDTLEKPSGWELEGRTLGLIGFGAIGTRVAELLAPMRMKVIATDPVVPAETIRARGAEPVDLPELLRRSDVVSVHARPSGDAKPIVGRGELAQMRRGSFLINTSRGVNVDELAVADALVSGQLAGAALDVFDSEPLPPGHPLLEAPNALLTPHVAGVSEDVPIRTARAVASAVDDWVSGRPLANVL